MKNYRAELTGVFGDPVDDNPTGVIEEAAYAALGLNYRYLTVRVAPEDLETAMHAVRAFGMRGVNLTMPHKIRVLPLLDELTPAAEIIGAVNTVINDGGRLIGENTDGKGFTEALRKDGVDLRGSRITLLGSGGAARAVGVECALAGAAEMTIVSRTAESGESLAGLIRERTQASARRAAWAPRCAIPADTDILINATSVGFMPHSGEQPDLDYDTLRPGTIVCDVVFNPIDPRFLRTARARGARTFSGIGMLVQQAALNFTLWTGREAPVGLMYETLAAEFA